MIYCIHTRSKNGESREKTKLRLLISLMLILSTLVSLNACIGDMSETKEKFVEVTRGDITLSATGDGDLSLLRQTEVSYHG